MDALGSSAYYFTLTPKDLDPNLDDDPTGLYNDTVSALLAAVARRFRGPVYAVAEVGKGYAGRRGRLHVHVVGHRFDGLQHIRRSSKRCQPVYDVLGLYRYLAKPPEPWSLEAEIDAAAARALRPSGRLPNTRRHLVTTERLAWAEANTHRTNTHRTKPPNTHRTKPPNSQPEPRSTPDAAPPLDAPKVDAPPQLPPLPTVPSSTSRASTFRPSARFGNLVDRLVATTAPPAPLEGRAAQTSETVRRVGCCSSCRARGPPGSAPRPSVDPSTSREWRTPE